MNVIFCTSPFQVLVAREIARYTNLEFYGMYLLMSDDSRQKIYAEKMKEFCEDVCILHEENLLETLKNFLSGKTISSMYLASLDNPVALSFFNPKRMQLFTFDDGSTSIIVPNMYTQNKNRIVSPLGLTLGQIMSLSQNHFTVFEKTELFEEGRQIPLCLDTKPVDFKRANNGQTLRVFLGQALGSVFDEEDIEVTKYLTQKAIQDCGADIYYPHPRVAIEIEDVQVATPSKCFEEEIYELLAEYEFVEVYGFYSTSFIFAKKIEGVKVEGYRTFLSSFESDILSNQGVPNKNLSSSDSCVDIVMPTYNSAKTIEDSIQSVLNQTHQQFRLWIVDDGSTDETQEVCQKYLNDSRIHYEKLVYHGISQTLIVGVNRTLGDYVAKIDSNDVWMPWHLETVLHPLEANPSLEIVGSRVNLEEPEKKQMLKINRQNHLYGETLWFQLAYRNLFHPSTVIFRKSVYEEAGGYQLGYDGYEDWHLWARMITKENAVVLNVITAYEQTNESYHRQITFRARLAKTRGLSLEEVLEGEVR